MGLFGKETCGICGGELDSDRHKVGDGFVCGGCARKLSPFFSAWRRSSTSEIKRQLAYRETNKADVAAFNVTRMFGGFTKVLLDDGARKMIVTSEDRWRELNPDVIGYSQVAGCDVEVHESRTEIWRERVDDSESDSDLPRYEIDLGIYVTIRVNNPWFDAIEFKVHHEKIDEKDSPEFESARQRAFEIRSALIELA